MINGITDIAIMEAKIKKKNKQPSTKHYTEKKT